MREERECFVCVELSISLSLSPDDFLSNYLFLTIGVVGGTTSDIDQSVVAVGEYEKKEKLQEILTGAGESPTHTLTPSQHTLTQERTGLWCLWRPREMQTIWPASSPRRSSLPRAFTGG